MYSNNKSTNVGSNIFVNEQSANVDYKYGPYQSIDEAYDTLCEDNLDVIAVGLTVGIITDSGIEEYWFKDGLLKENLVKKNQGSNASSNVTDEDIERWNNKQEYIEDLEDIRKGSAAGKTALQESDMPEWSMEPIKPSYTASEVGALPDSTKLFSGSYKDLTDKPEIPVLSENIVTDPSYIHTDNNFTNGLLEKLNSLSNYDDTDVKALIQSVTDAVNAITENGKTTEAIDTFNEIVSFLNTFQNTDNLTSVLSALKTEIEQWVEGKNYLTEHQDISGKVDKEEGKGLSAVTDVTVTEDGKLDITKEDGSILEFEGGGGLPLSVVEGKLCITFNK